MSRIDDALARASDTKALSMGVGTINDAAKIFAGQFPGASAVIVADKTTYEIAGRQVQRLLEEAGIAQDTPCVFGQDVYASWEWVEKLDAVLSRTNAVPVAVGSGTINDLTKLSSHRNGRPYMCVATAASMDGYTAFGASITFQGAKQTFSCPAPAAIIADTGIIAAAPAIMTSSGYADLFAKIPAGADWILSDALGVEPIDGFAFSLVQDNLKSALSDTEGIRTGSVSAIEHLTEGLIFGGFAMQAHKSSRPASGADHQFSHLWDMEHHKTEDGTAPSHGFKVSIGLLASTALYEELLNHDMANLDIEACVAAWHSREDMERTAAEMFRGTDFPTIGVTEYGAKYVSRDELRGQLTLLRNGWEGIRDALREHLTPFAKAAEMLRSVGAPVLPEQIGIARERLLGSKRRAMYIRRRFTVLDIADRCGMLDQWVDHIFAPGRLWEIT